MKDCNCDLREGDAKTSVFGSNEMLQPAPVDTIPMEPYHSADCLSNGKRRNICSNPATS